MICVAGCDNNCGMGLAMLQPVTLAKAHAYITTQFAQPLKQSNGAAMRVAGCDIVLHMRSRAVPNASVPSKYSGFLISSCTLFASPLT